MIIHYNDSFSRYNIRFQKPLSYMDDFTFVPVKITEEGCRDPCILQTPLLFSPYGIQTRDSKQSVVLSFLNRKNDKSLDKFYEHLRNIYNIVRTKYSKKYTVNEFLRETMYGECLRLKVNNHLSVFDQTKERTHTIPSFSYGWFMMNLHGLWISENQLWFQWYLVQAKIIVPIHFQEYMFIDDSPDPEPPPTRSPKNDKYEKMLKMGVPKDAVDRQRSLDMNQISRTQVPNKPGIPPPPPPPIGGFPDSGGGIPKITSAEIKNVRLKKMNRPPEKPKILEDGYFEPPSLDDIQTMLKRLKPIP